MTRMAQVVGCLKMTKASRKLKTPSSSSDAEESSSMRASARIFSSSLRKCAVAALRGR